MTHNFTLKHHQLTLNPDKLWVTAENKSMRGSDIMSFSWTETKLKVVLTQRRANKSHRRIQLLQLNSTDKTWICCSPGPRPGSGCSPGPSPDSSETHKDLYHLKKVSRIKGLRSQQDLENAFPFSWIKNCNSIFTGLIKRSIRQLQLTQNLIKNLIQIPAAGLEPDPGPCSWSRILQLSRTLRIPQLS